MFMKFLFHLRQQYLGALALFIVLGGTSYAVATNSIDSRQIKNNSIRSKDIRNNQVSSSDVRNGSLLGKDFKAGQLPAGPQGNTGSRGATAPQGARGEPCPPSDPLCRGPKGDTGATGAAGPQGDTGATGAQGAPGVSGYEHVESPAVSIPAHSVRGGSATCPAGKRPLGGGAISTFAIDVSTNASFPSVDSSAWQVVMNNNGPNASSFRVVAICAVVR